MPGMASEASIVWNKEGEERIPRPFGRLWLLRRLVFAMKKFYHGSIRHGIYICVYMNIDDICKGARPMPYFAKYFSRADI